MVRLLFLRGFLRVDTLGYSSGLDVRPLGLRAAVPPEAGTVDTADVLRSDFPDVARVAEDPAALLVDPLVWPPEGPPVCFEFLGDDYENYVHDGISAGFQRVLLQEELVCVQACPSAVGLLRLRRTTRRIEVLPH